MHTGYWIALVGLVWSALLALGTWYFAVSRMQHKYARLPDNGRGYQKQSAAELCITERRKAESSTMKMLGRMEKRMALGNIVMRDLVEASPDVPNDKIEKYQRDLGINLMDMNFEIPEG